MNGSLHLWLIPLLPFAGFLINGLLGRRLPKWLVTYSCAAGAAGIVLRGAFYVVGPLCRRSECF